MTPTDQVLYDKVKKEIYEQNPVHSAYRSGTIVKKYKEEFVKEYGKEKKPYAEKKPTKTGLKRWFNEDWRNQRGELGYKYKSDVYRPTKRITKKTPKTYKELSKKRINKARTQKYRKGKVHKF
jgi:hypothetical protein